MPSTWPEDTRLSPYDGGGVPVSPGAAYRGMPDDVALAAAVVDSLVWDMPGWVADVASWQAAEPPVIAPSGYDRLLVEHGWHDAQDVLDAAHVSAQQGQVLRLAALGWDHRSIGKELGTTALTSRIQLSAATAKLHKLVVLTLDCNKGGGSNAP